MLRSVLHSIDFVEEYIRNNQGTLKKKQISIIKNSKIGERLITAICDDKVK
jgi:hypothetical protein